ncbi:flavin monoamine oxidase family protein [Granulosicoccus antarcticus]|uniref:Flavin-containing monoamine oxidase AofH n=1 Tax=Granulosicoccus antarcticus IMCC3135 TaxID=1192854 RepID=A0A2Z2NZU2_9GAMM|nr:FAD-dependent oxidoreductase [Granulosicoccus antarcticus]ASJ76809.1 Putative flavin-containing monoamine oxidase AofH [Granulosicoccus antarcticus IMCC3135]
MKPVVLIVGGGLSGLCAAYRLTLQGIPFRLLEARDRLGGRIHSAPTGALDLGPSWFWPGQRQIASLIAELGLEQSIYPQVSEGLSIMEYGDGSLQKSLGGASMAGSNRIDGGMKQLIDSLVSVLPGDSLQINSNVQHLVQTPEGVTVRVKQSGIEQEMQAAHLILALPPRVVADSITFEPGLPSKDRQLLAKIPTWMAAQAKFVAEYSEPFWQEQGLSGDGFSQLGPLTEIHDASPRTGGNSALFGFVGIPAEQRPGQEQALKQAGVAQLARMFGEAASQPIAVHLKDWAFDAQTATALDRDPVVPRSHGRPTLMSEWDNRLIWAGSETAGLTDHSNGYLEGAVESGNRAAALIIKLMSDG